MDSTTVSINIKSNKIRSFKIKKPLRNEVGNLNDSSKRINQASQNNSQMLIQDNKSSSRYILTKEKLKSAIISK